MLDELIGTVDRALRTLSGAAKPERPLPDVGDCELDDAERRHVAGLMRVNHAGEICAQALYEGQALCARDEKTRAALLGAADEERDHLVWCRERLTELDAKPSVLDPLFYAASCALGVATGLMGDKVSLGFVEATEDQVVKHLDGHLTTLPERDLRSRTILEEMRRDEARHGSDALRAGGAPFPKAVRRAMTLVSKLMTETTYRI